MARLRTLSGPVGALPRAVGVLAGPDRDRERDARLAYRRWYKTARWRALADAVVRRDRMRCARCGQIAMRRAELVCDHIAPHRGDWEAFWRGPFQTLCRACHSSAKQREERGGVV